MTIRHRYSVEPVYQFSCGVRECGQHWSVDDPEYLPLEVYCPRCGTVAIRAMLPKIDTHTPPRCPAMANTGQTCLLPKGHIGKHLAHDGEQGLEWTD